MVGRDLSSRRSGECSEGPRGGSRPPGPLAVVPSRDGPPPLGGGDLPLLSSPPDRIGPARAVAGLARTATPVVAAAGRLTPGVETDLPALTRAPFFTIRTCPPPGTELGPRTNGSTLVSALPIHWDSYRDRVHSSIE